MYLFEGWEADFMSNTDLRAYKTYWPIHWTSLKTLQQYELNTIKIRSHAATTRQLRSKFHDHSWLFHQPLMKKLAIVGRLFWLLGTRFSDHCRCGVVKTRVNVWNTVHWDKKVVAANEGSTVYHYWLANCVKYWRTNYCLSGILTYWLNNSLTYWLRLDFNLPNEWLIVLTLQSG